MHAHMVIKGLSPTISGLGVRVGVSGGLDISWHLGPATRGS